VIVNVWKWLLTVEVEITSVPPPCTDRSWAWVILKLWACPRVVDVDEDIPADGGLSMSDLDIVTVWLCPDTVEDLKVCEFDGFEGPAGELEELEQPYPTSRATHARTPSNPNRLAVIWLSFRLTPMIHTF
jgi:hypothetical protein